MDTIKVLLVDEDQDWLKLMINYLNWENDIRVVGSATNEQKAYQLATNIDFQVVIIDLIRKGNKYGGFDLI